MKGLRLGSAQKLLRLILGLDKRKHKLLMPFQNGEVFLFDLNPPNLKCVIFLHTTLLSFAELKFLGCDITLHLVVRLQF